MASSLQTLVKILRLEQQKNYENKAVIGGFARFAYHWAREAHGQARAQEHHDLVDQIAEQLRIYETTETSERPALIEEIIALASGEPQAMDKQSPPAEQQISTTAETASETKTETIAEVEEEVYEQPEPIVQKAAEEQPAGVRNRRGYAHRPPSLASMDTLADIDASVLTLNGVGEKRGEQLAKLGASTVSDLIHLYPRRYDDYSRMLLIKDLKPDEEVTVIGFMEDIKVHKMKRGGVRVEAFLNDDSAKLRLNWFNQPWIQKQLQDGEPYVVSGKTDQYLGRLVMNSPELESLEKESLHAGRVVPVYPLTEGLGARTLRNLMKSVIDDWSPRLPDYLPLAVRERVDLMDYDDAIFQAHFPDSWEDMEAAQYRLAFDDLFVLHMAMLQRRYLWQSQQAVALDVSDDWLDAFIISLPFTLTDAQRNAINDVIGDIDSNIPMNRLLQGDVGSGKTIIAATAAGITANSGHQAAIMAPTSILAEQHFSKLTALFDADNPGTAINIALLTSNVTDSERERIYNGLRDGSINVVVGTHALIQQPVEFKSLALAVIDEQHRFGVSQRGALREKAGQNNPHLLIMTATPIPRTLTLTLHADLDLTIIDELPPGRQPIATRILQQKERERAYAYVRGQIEQGRQAYIICPLVEDSEQLDAKSAVAEYERLQQNVYPDLNVGLLHGRMRPDEKDSVMEAFYQGDIDVLVSTTVIEVGIDVPNASTIVIENANRFGLAQLHQLRGRVGRGEHESYCLLISDKHFLDGDDRLSILEQTNDGFKLAEKDWEIRGPGNLLGTQQSGYGTFRFTSRVDIHLLEKIQREAQALFELDPTLELSEHQLLAQYVSQVSRSDSDMS